jgi:hypothetical protein
MKLYAIFDSKPKPDARLTGNWHSHTVPNGELFVCEPFEYATAEAHVANLGGIILPHVIEHASIGDAAKHPAVAGIVLAEDTSYQALRKLHAKFKWAILDPRNR